MPAVVLIADDDKEVRTFVRLALKQLFRVEEAPDGPTALRRFEELRPACVVTDLGMPGMNGMDLARKIKEHPELGDTPVIILTGATKGEEVDPAVWLLGTTADRFFEKPVDPDVLRSTVDALIKKRVGYKPLPPGKGSYD